MAIDPDHAYQSGSVEVAGYSVSVVMQKEALIMQLIMSFLLWMRLVLLIPGRKAATANRAGGGSPLYEVSAVEEFAGQQGFEAKLVLSGGFGDDALGQDISPLSFIVRYPTLLFYSRVLVSH